MADPDTAVVTGRRSGDGVTVAAGAEDDAAAIEPAVTRNLFALPCDGGCAQLVRGVVQTVHESGIHCLRRADLTANALDSGPLSGRP